MRRVPLLSGSRVVVVPVDDEDVIIRPPPPPARIVDTTAAVRDALQIPALRTVPRVDRCRAEVGATIVVEPPAFPFPARRRIRDRKRSRQR